MRFGLKNNILIAAFLLAFMPAAQAESPLLNSDFATQPLEQNDVTDDMITRQPLGGSDDKDAFEIYPNANMTWCNFVNKYKDENGFLNPDYEDNENLNPNLGNGERRIGVPDDYQFTLTLDLDQMNGINLPSGIDMEAPIETVTFQNGHVYYGDKQLSSDDEAALERLCRQSTLQTVPEQTPEQPAQ